MVEVLLGPGFLEPENGCLSAGGKIFVRDGNTFNIGSSRGR